MNRSIALVLTAAALTSAGVTTAHAAFVPVYGGLTFNPSTNIGYQDPQYLNAPFGITAGSGIGVATTGFFPKVFVYSGTVAEQITPTGTTAYSGIATTSGKFVATGVSGVTSTGTAVGFSELIDSSGTDQGPRAVVWTAGSTVATQLAAPAGTTLSAATSISSSGTTVGGWASQPGSGEKPVVWTGGVAQTLSTLGYTTLPTSAQSVPNQTSVTAISGTHAIGNLAINFNSGNGTSTRSVVWDLANGGAATELQPLDAAGGNPLSSANAINASGKIIGVSADVNGDTHAVTWSASDATGTPTQLGNIGTYTDGSGRWTSNAYAVNSSGVAVGNATLTGAGDFQAVVWSANGTATQLGSLGSTTYGYNNNAAYAINDSGTIVGAAEYFNPDGSTIRAFNSILTHAVVWQGTTPIDLNTLIDPNSGWVLVAATSISNDGWVSGEAIYDTTPNDAASGYGNGYLRDFLIQLPSAAAVPEPASLGTLVLGASVLMRRHRKN